MTWDLTECGPDCMRIANSTKALWDLHRQGNVWTGTGTEDTAALDNDTLVLTLQFPSGDPNVVIGLVKNA